MDSDTEDPLGGPPQLSLSLSPLDNRKPERENIMCAEVGRAVVKMAKERQDCGREDI